jgi:hypothetical protein
LNISSFAAIAERSGKVDDTFFGVYSPDRNMTMGGHLRARKPGDERGARIKAERGKHCQGLIVPMSAKGTKQTSISTLNMSAFGGKADIPDRFTDVR